MNVSSNKKKALIVGLSASVLFFVPITPATAQSCVQPPSGQVSWWPGDGDSTDIVGANSGTLQNGTTFAVGQVDQAFSFDGVDDFVEIPHDTSLDDFSQATIDAWINLDTIVGRQAIVSKVPSGNYYLLVDEGRLSFENNVIPFGGFLGSTVLAPNTWYHVAATWDGVTTILYVNGQVDGSMVVGWDVVPGNTNTVKLGQRGQNDDFFRGLIDEVEIHNQALAQLDIQDILSAGSAGKCKESTVQVEIDVKPGSDPNCFNINGHGVIPVAIFGSETFDVLAIDTDALFFAGLEVRVRGKKGPMCHGESVNNDIHLDLVCQFEDDPSMWDPDSNSEATVEGQLFSGIEFEGTDSICVVP